MTTEKTFVLAGVSTLNNITKVRVANGADRVKVLLATGHKDIDLIQLKHPMTKKEAVDYLISIDFDNGNAAIRAVLEDAQADFIEVVKEPKAPKAAKTPKEPKATKNPMDIIIYKVAAKLESDAIAAQTALDEEEGLRIAAEKFANATNEEEQVNDPALDDAPF